MFAPFNDPKILYPLGSPCTYGTIPTAKASLADLNPGTAVNWFRCDGAEMLRFPCRNFCAHGVFNRSGGSKGNTCANVSLIPWRKQTARYLARSIPQKHMVRKWRGILSRRGVAKGCDWLKRGNRGDRLGIIDPAWVVLWRIKGLAHIRSP